MPPYADGPGYGGGAAYGRADAYRPDQPAGQGYANPGYAPSGAGAGAGAGPAPGHPGDPAGQARAAGYPGTNGNAGPAGRGRPGGGYGETVNGGAYAYVIREEDEFPLPERRQPAPERAADTNRQPRQDQRSPQDRPSQGQRPRPEPPRPEPLRPEPLRPEPSRPQPSPAEPPRAAPPRPDTTEGSGPPAFVRREAGGAESAGQQDAAEPAVPYGPDDPAYGPPSADWYRDRDREREREREEEEEAAAEPVPEDLSYARGPFEPLPQSDVAVQAALYQALTDDPRADDNVAGGTSERALKRIKDLYAAADAVGDEGLDKHFERLLDRQRQLISDYLKEFGSQGSQAPQGRDTPDGAHDRDGVTPGTGERSPR